jgi:hypothetical protein
MKKFLLQTVLLVDIKLENEKSLTTNSFAGRVDVGGCQESSAESIFAADVGRVGYGGSGHRAVNAVSNL